MPTPTVRVSLAPWFVGADPISPVEGAGGFYGLVPVAEPVSAGEPPYPHDLVEEYRYSISRRDARSVSNHHGGMLLDTAKRPVVTVRWTGRTKAVRDAVLAFLRTTCGEGAAAFTARPDGPGTQTVKLRATSPAKDTRTGKGVYTIEVECEEVW